MKSFTLPVLFFIFAAMSNAAEVRFYIGTFTNHNSKGIYTCDLDTETGKLGPVRLAVEAPDPNFLALSPDGRFLYAATQVPGSSSAAAFRVEPDGALTLLNTQPTGDGACHVWVDQSGGNVLTANYNDAHVACFQTKPDGSLGERTAFVAFTGSGPDPRRQTKSHAHSIYTDSTDRFVYSCDLGSDTIWIFKFDAAHGTLTPVDPPSAKAPPGGGPRHLAFNPNGRFVYMNNEMGLSVTVFARDPDTGALTPVQTLPTLAPGVSNKGATSSEIFCDPAGKRLYVSDRGPDTIAFYAIGGDSRLTWIDSAPAQVKSPRGFAIDPTGRWLVTAGQSDNRIAVLKIDPATGRLTATDQSAEVGEPVCITFSPVHLQPVK